MTGVPTAAAMCIKPVSGPTATFARAMIPTASLSEVRPTKLVIPDRKQRSTSPARAASASLPSKTMPRP